MARKTIALSWLVAGLVLAGCGGGSPSADVEPASVPPSTATAEQPGGSPNLTGRGGLVRIEDESMRVVRGYTAQFYAGELTALHERFSDEFKLEMPLAGLQQLHDSVRSELGRELEVIGEDSRVDGEYRGFVRWARFEKYDGVVQIVWILREDDTIAGFRVRTDKQPQG